MNFTIFLIIWLGSILAATISSRELKFVSQAHLVRARHGVPLLSDPPDSSIFSRVFRKFSCQ